MPTPLRNILHTFGFYVHLSVPVCGLHIALPLAQKGVVAHGETGMNDDDFLAFRHFFTNYETYNELQFEPRLQRKLCLSRSFICVLLCVACVPQIVMGFAVYFASLYLCRCA